MNNNEFKRWLLELNKEHYKASIGYSHEHVITSSELKEKVNQLNKELIESIELDSSLITSTENDLDIDLTEIKKKKGRPPIDMFNTYYEKMNEVDSYDHLSSWVDDVFNGAARSGLTGSKATPALLFHLLHSLPFITSTEIKNHINRKRSVSGYNPIKGDRYPQLLLSMMVRCIRSLDYHIERGKKLCKDYTPIFNLSEDRKGWEGQKAKCEELGLPVTTNLNNPFSDIPYEERLLLAGLTPAEIKKRKSGNWFSLHTYSSTENKYTGKLFKDTERWIEMNNKNTKTHNNSYSNKNINELPLMVDLDTGEIYYCEMLA